MFKRSILLIAVVFAVGCASTPDPDEVCTTRWVSERSFKAVDNILGETEDTVGAIRKVAARYAEGKSPNVFQLFSLSSKVKNLEDELLKGSGIKDLKTLARTCNDPAILTDGISSFVDRLELPAKMRSFMENLPEYRNLVTRHLQDITN